MLAAYPHLEYANMGGIFGGLFGGSAGASKSSGSSESTSTSTATQTGKTSSDTKSTTTKMDEASKKILDSLTKYLQDTLPTVGTGFDKASAITDASGVVQNIFNQFKTTALPQIAIGMQTGGIYNSTQGQQLANEAFGKATATASQLVLDNITKYAGLKQQDQSLTLSGLLNALNLQQGAVTSAVGSTTGDTSTLTNTTTSSRESGSSTAYSGGSKFGA